MAGIIFKNKEYSLFDFNDEDDFEKAVIENQKILFGKKSIYIDIKKRIGLGRHQGIPDAFLIDFFDLKKPYLYIVENELASHSAYAHIGEQILRFRTSTVTSGNQIRKLLIDTIENKPELKKEIEALLTDSAFKTVTELMLFLCEQDIKIVIAINEITSDLGHVCNNFINPPDIVLLQRYTHDNDISYYYEPMREEVENTREGFHRLSPNIFDTIVCAAFEDGFKHAYIENNAWWAIRLSQVARENLKYLAIYEKAPIAHISHYAEIEKIEPYEDTGKYILYLKNKKTIRPIKLSKNSNGEAPQSPRYTSIEKLLKAKSIKALWA